METESLLQLLRQLTEQMREETRGNQFLKLVQIINQSVN